MLKHSWLPPFWTLRLPVSSQVSIVKMVWSTVQIRTSKFNNIWIKCEKFAQIYLKLNDPCDPIEINWFFSVKFHRYCWCDWAFRLIFPSHTQILLDVCSRLSQMCNTDVWYHCLSSDECFHSPILPYITCVLTTVAWVKNRSELRSAASLVLFQSKRLIG